VRQTEAQTGMRRHPGSAEKSLLLVLESMRGREKGLQMVTEIATASVMPHRGVYNVVHRALYSEFHVPCSMVAQSTAVRSWANCMPILSYAAAWLPS